MKKIYIVVVGALILSMSAQAAPRTKSTNTERPIETSYSAPAAGNTGGGRFGLGVSSLSALGNGAATAGMELGQNGFFQGFLELTTTAAFRFFVTGAYKHTIAGTMHGSGFHIGGLVGLGLLGGGGVAAAAGTNFGMNIGALMGVHVPVTNNVMFHFDGGPTFSLVTTTPTQTGFSLATSSALLGASVLYMF